MNPTDNLYDKSTLVQVVAWCRQALPKPVLTNISGHMASLDHGEFEPREDVVIQKISHVDVDPL